MNRDEPDRARNLHTAQVKTSGVPAQDGGTALGCPSPGGRKIEND